MFEKKGCLLARSERQGSQIEPLLTLIMAKTVAARMIFGGVWNCGGDDGWEYFSEMTPDRYSSVSRISFQIIMLIDVAMLYILFVVARDSASRQVHRRRYAFG